MTAKTLRAKLREEDTEVRRAAALACAMKDDKEYVPDLDRALGRPGGNGRASRTSGVESPGQAGFRSACRRDRGPATQGCSGLEIVVEETGEIERWFSDASEKRR